MSDPSTKINVITFKGDKRKFDEWMIKTKSIAKAKGWDEAMNESFDPSADESTSAKDAKGVQYLTLACEDRAFKIIKNKTTTKEMIAALKSRYEKKTVKGYIALLEKFTSSKMLSSKDDPEDWILELEDLNLQMKSIDPSYEKSETEMRAKILLGLPEQYSELLTVETEATTKPLSETIESIVDFYDRKFSNDKSDGKEILLSAIECYRCGKKGHYSRNCKVKKFIGNCNQCGGKGHKKAQCWELGSNKSKRPKGWKSKREHAQVQVEPDEIQLVSIDECDEIIIENIELLSDCDSLNSNDDSCADMPSLKSRGHSSNNDSSCESMPSLMSRDDSSNSSRAVSENDDLSNRDVDAHDAIVLDGKEAEVACANATQVLNDQRVLYHPDIWIVDTAATSHNTAHSEGVTPTESPKQSDNVIVGTGHQTNAVCVGKLKGDVCDSSGNVVHRNTVLNDVIVLPKSKFNLISAPVLLNNGWILHGNKKRIMLVKDEVKLVFDIKVCTNRGALYCMKYRRHPSPSEIGNVNVDSMKEMSYDEFHQLIGHVGKQMTVKIAKLIGYKLKHQNVPPCESCTVAKAKRKEIVKKSDHVKSEAINERIFLDISSVKVPKDKTPINSKRFWCMTVEESVGYKCSAFYRTKSEMVEPTVNKLIEWKNDNKEVKNIRMDNAGENVKLSKLVKSPHNNLNVNIEFTARNTPEQNSPVEQGFTTIYSRAKAAFHAARVPMDIRYKIFPDWITTVTLYDNLCVVNYKNELKSRYQHVHGVLPKWINNIKTLGEAGTVTITSKINKKLADKGVTCMFVGFDENHAGDCYKMWNEDNNTYYLTRDVVFLHRMYYEKPSRILEITVEPMTVSIPTNNDSGNNLLSSTPADNETSTSTFVNQKRNDDNDRIRWNTITGDFANSDVSQGVFLENNNDISLENKDANVYAINEIIDDDSTSNEDSIYENNYENDEINYEQDGVINNNISAMNNDSNEQPTAYKTRYGRETRKPVIYTYGNERSNPTFNVQNNIFEYELVGAGIGGGFSNTDELKVLNFKKAMKSNDKEKWIEAIDEEWNRMKKAGAFKAVDRTSIDKNEKILTSTWAMKKKASGKYRARLNARGYEQQPGVHYFDDDISSPTVNDTTIRVLFVLMLMAEFDAHIVDICGAFLLGRFGREEVMFMEVPDGFEQHFNENEIIELQVPIYGCKQSGRAFYKELSEACSHMGMQRNAIDPCVFFRWNEDGISFIASWIDDLLNIGSDRAINNIKLKLMNLFECTDEGPMKEYVGCKIDVKKNSKTMRITQPVLLQSLSDEFELPKGNPVTPLPAGYIMKKGNNDELIGPKQQKIYRSGSGKILHLSRWSRPECRNAVREISRFNSGATEQHFGDLHRVMKHFVTTPERGWILKPERAWDGKDKQFKFKILGKSDETFASCPDTSRSTTGGSVFLEGAPVVCISQGQTYCALSVTESALIAAVTVTQHMLFIMNLLRAFDLQVELPMIIEIDNKGCVDLINNWSVAGRTRHISVKKNFMRELKEQGIIMAVWKPGHSNSSDLFTKNLGGPTFNKHSKEYVCGDNEW
jgi:hypothetical protein